MEKNESYKFEILEYIFNSKTNNGKNFIGTDITFTLPEIGKGFEAVGKTKPTSYSNFVLDLTRKNKGIERRLPQAIYSYGYDLRKKTGRVTGTKVNFCGEFVYTGKDELGNTRELCDWLVWGKPDKKILVNNCVPMIALPHLSNDEPSLFSVIDYCDILTRVLNTNVYRVQSPMKWQPNEIDGYYISENHGNLTVYPVEAKAVSTDDDINLVQMYGQYQTLVKKFAGQKTAIVRPIAVKMTSTGMMIAILENNAFYSTASKTDPMFHIHEIIEIELDKKIPSWG